MRRRRLRAPGVQPLERRRACSTAALPLRLFSRFREDHAHLFGRFLEDHARFFTRFVEDDLRFPMRFTPAPRFVPSARPVACAALTLAAINSVSRLLIKMLQFC